MATMNEQDTPIPKKPGMTLWGIVKFNDDTVDPAVFRQLVCSPFYWLQSGAKLIRAARAVMHQVELDGKEMPIKRSRVDAPAIMLAAMGCEDGLKAVIVAKKWPTPPTEEVEAMQAGIVAANPAEQSAIEEGRYFIQYAGRYPTMKTADDTPNGYFHQAPSLLTAYDRLFLRCGEEAGRAYQVPEYGLTRTVLERMIGGVPEP